MMYLKQFPDICREMGFDVEEKAKTIKLWHGKKSKFSWIPRKYLTS